MNTLQLIKARTVRNQAIETARTQMARAYRHQGNTDRVHTPVGGKTKVPVSYTHLTLPTSNGV